MELFSALQIGLIYSFVALGVYISFRVMDFADLTVDGSFMLGSAVTATLLVKKIDPCIVLVISSLAGFACGMITAYLNMKWNIISLLAGILVMLCLYSVNLRIMGKPNISLIDEVNVFSNVGNTINILLFILVFVYCGVVYLLYTHYGLGLRATGINKRMSEAYGINVKRMTYVGLGLSNALIALSGSLFTQSFGFSDISMGTGTVTIGLASVIIGEKLFPSKKMYLALLSSILGAIIFRYVVSAALNSTDIGLKSSDLNAITSFIIIIAFICTKKKKLNIFKRKEG